MGPRRTRRRRHPDQHQPNLPSGTVTVSFSPGISVGASTMFPDQHIVDVSVNPPPLGRWHPVDASEVLRDLTELASTRTPATT
ncbi:hypothetical protein M1M07_21135 [Rhodococcus sp. HM1]|uniref:hypothetical protein n=1 Tax=Rhodococcus sp. HM1 TaxID=2937759 RepID=UPI00200A0744|nr:hypothetical protein [Rhodococcus sp. HM1]MCK8673599.1 hypothetical protein [Rhodococcus sp. HM1]